MAMKVMKGLERLSYKEGLRVQGLFSRDLINVGNI